ncbi:metallophosphoesterase [Thermococcus sp. MV5]|uniref:YfcE family phosphodiesterase n=1 Tax=Thermococcus sp. MV5 TaxID=1638272 RepID=UPI001438D590|nr:metallophosphoesterase [Thermococcus sp. MV5]
MKVGILSDTHYPDKTSYLPDLLFNVFKDEKVELILHAGDLTAPELLERFEEIAPIIAVRGNLDKPFLPEEKVLEIEGLRIGLLHGHRFLSLDEQTLKYKALEMGVDILIFGHTHRFFYKRYEYMGKEVILLNPGSPTIPRMSDPTFLVGEIRHKKFSFRIFKPWETQWGYP